jgi:phage tail tape-measure protein
MKTETEQEILKEIEYGYREIKSNISEYDKDGAYDDLQELKAKLEGYQLAQKETAEKVEKLKEHKGFKYRSSSALYMDGMQDMIDYALKIFNEDKK